MGAGLAWHFHQFFPFRLLHIPSGRLPHSQRRPSLILFVLSSRQKVYLLLVGESPFSDFYSIEIWTTHQELGTYSIQWRSKMISLISCKYPLKGTFMFLFPVKARFQRKILNTSVVHECWFFLYRNSSVASSERILKREYFLSSPLIACLFMAWLKEIFSEIFGLEQLTQMIF